MTRKEGKAGKKINKLKLRLGQPGTGGRAGPVDFWPWKKIRFFDPVTPGRNPMSGR